ncbi:vacuolar protein sorting-associated protein 16B [Chironomus tepperi]|uniref:vacuolar protein sorting-associated protein 16B n=1 Tax=Chironomus tepperi TaxID=113505 RepID=UPI00391F9C0A
MDQDDYWNVSHSKSFCFDDLDEIEEQTADDNISEISTQSSISLGAIINENDLQVILDEEIDNSDSVIPKGLTLEEEVKFLRRKVNEFYYANPASTINKILLNNSCSLECYKSLKEKEQLLDAAIQSGNGDGILKVLFYLRNTLKPAIFLKIIAPRSEAVEHYINYLKTTMKIGEATDILTMLDRREEAALLQFSAIVQSKNAIQKLDKLKKTQELFTNPFLLNQVQSYINLLELQINERMYFQPSDVIDKSVLETLYSACNKFQKFSEPTQSTSSTNPFKIVEQFNVAPAQFEWIALNERAKSQAWRDIESLFEKKSSMLKKKTFAIHIPLEIVILKLHQLRAPQAVLNSFLQHVEDTDRRLTLSKKVGAIHSIVDSLTILKDKRSLEEFKESLPSGTAEYFYTEKAITSITSTKSLLNLRKNSSFTN